MKFTTDFLNDIAEAFEFWKVQQLANPRSEVTKEQLDVMSVEQWVAGILQQPIYTLIGQKRTRNATEKAQKNPKREECRS